MNEQPSTPMPTYAYDNYQGDDSTGPFQYFQTDYNAGLRASRELKARQEQEESDAMHASLRAFNQANSQATEALNTPASVPSYYIGSSSSSSSSSSAAAAVPTGGWFPAGSSSDTDADVAARIEEARRKANIKSQSYQINTTPSNYQGPKPGGGPSGPGFNGRQELEAMMSNFRF
jgi:altronate dehydratase